MERDDAPRHLYHFTPATLSKLLGKVGFELLDLRCQGSTPSLAVNLLRAGKSLIRRQSRRTNTSLSESLQQEMWNEEFKDKIRRVAATLVAPIASTIDRFGWGAAIRVYAQKRCARSIAG